MQRLVLSSLLLAVLAMPALADTCTDYFANPRHARIKAVLDANRIKPQQAPLKRN